MGQIPETPANPFFLINFHLLEQIILTANDTELKRHSLYDIIVVIIFDKMEKFASFFVVVLGYEKNTLIWSIFLLEMISLHMCLMF